MDVPVCIFIDCFHKNHIKHYLINLKFSDFFPPKGRSHAFISSASFSSPQTLSDFKVLEISGKRRVRSTQEVNENMGSNPGFVTYLSGCEKNS